MEILTYILLALLVAPLLVAGAVAFLAGLLGAESDARIVGSAVTPCTLLLVLGSIVAAISHTAGERLGRLFR